MLLEEASNLAQKAAFLFLQLVLCLLELAREEGDEGVRCLLMCSRGCASPLLLQLQRLSVAACVLPWRKSAVGSKASGPAIACGFMCAVLSYA